MPLTQKDKELLEQLKSLMASRDLSVELRQDRPSYMVLHGTYGDKVHKAFRMTRQGVRWRFWRVFNGVYVSAFEAILAIEKVFGTQLRDHAVRISQERHALRQEAVQSVFHSADDLGPGPRAGGGGKGQVTASQMVDNGREHED